MYQPTIDYIRSLKPEPHADGRELVRKGIEIGNTFTCKPTYKKGFANHMEYKKHLQKEGKIYWTILMGLATMEDELKGIQEIYEFTERTGFELGSMLHIPSGNIALPSEYREKAPKTTSFVMNDLSDWMALHDAAPIDISLNDHHLICPNSIETTVNALKAGAVRVGSFGQFLWDYAGFTDNVKRYSDMVTSLGIMASKRDDMFCVETYLDDSFPGYFMDCASYCGYALIEHYICTELCGARYVISYGGLLSEGHTRIAVGLALHKLMGTEEQPVLTYINGSTNMQWDHDLDANYGFAAQEMLLEICAEKKFHMSMGINPVSITEKVAVPTRQELQNIYSVGKRVEEKAEEWMPLIDWTLIEEMADKMVGEAKLYFDRAMTAFREAGIDTGDPLEMLLMLKKFQPARLESCFHSSTYDGKRKEVEPMYPTVLGRQTNEMRDEIIEDLLAQGLGGSLNGKKIVVASGDAHAYGLQLVDGVLRAMGADVSNIGVDMDPIDVLDAADEDNTPFVGISCHNGQALDYGRQLLSLAEERGKKYVVFMGGKLNSILPGDAEPTEIGPMLCEMGIQGDNQLSTTVKLIASCDAD
ncbi:MAG: cobalamin-dependent protein [Eubacteriales bacterium]|nr:cobalamin-dependent protein [Eubacteriales bacterium]